MSLRIEPLPRMAGHLSFMRTPRATCADLRPGMVAALGVALDSTRDGAGQTRFGPTALRETSAYFGSHFGSNMKAAMDIDRRRILDGGLKSGQLVDLGDLCVEGLDRLAAEAAIGSAAAAVSRHGALPLLLGGDLDIVPAAMAGLDATLPAATPLIQVGGHLLEDRRGRPVLRLGHAGPLRALPDTELTQRIAAVACGRRAFVALDLSAFAAPWHGMHGAAPFDGLGLRDMRRVVATLGQFPIVGIAITGLDATRCALSVVKTGQRLMLTALLDLLYRCMADDRLPRAASAA
jgi:agmatinase